MDRRGTMTKFHRKSEYYINEIRDLKDEAKEDDRYIDIMNVKEKEIASIDTNEKTIWAKIQSKPQNLDSYFKLNKNDPEVKKIN